jgi:hypothetical protein
MRSMGYSRDPVSVTFDGPARRLLDRAYASPGEWAQVRVADPGIRARTRFAGMGLADLTGPDKPSATGGTGLNARSRWCRGFVRALYYQHRNNSPYKTGGEWKPRRAPRNSGGLVVEVGRHIPASPQFDPAHPERGGFPPGRQVRVKLQKGGKAKLAAVKRLPDSRRIYDDAGNAAARWADPNKRDWA